MTESHRQLPAWMKKKEDKVKERETLRSSRKRRAVRSVFYCMNEKELVEAAVSFLTNEDVVVPTHQQVEEKAEHIPEKKEKHMSPQTEEESSGSGHELETTYVSETDFDITEAETLPYTKNPQHHGSEGQRSPSGHDHGGLVQGDVEEGRRNEQTSQEEDDTLRLVREIFFT